MANDFYTDEDNQQEHDLMEQEFHEWQVLNDVVALVATYGLKSVMQTIFHMMDERGIK